MNFWVAFFPYIISALLIVWMVLPFSFAFNVHYPVVTWTVYFLILTGLIGFGVYVLSDNWFKARPTPDWKTKAKDARAAIILGFGYEGESNNMQPGESNKSLLQWAINNTGADLFIVQEGVWAAADSNKNKKAITTNRAITLRKMHLHDSSKYVNTFEAAFCALTTLQKINNSKLDQIVLVAHDLQLQRAYWDFMKVMNSHPDWHKLSIILPEISNTPFVEKPAKGQFHTGGKFIYKSVELLLARPRDYITNIPRKLPAPPDSSVKIIGPVEYNSVISV
ncbi:MAG TPA: hypothetical protein PLE24_09620 [Chitinispirillaceae bacterium]|jgi:hypothetical protein|nr:hypothetical protein [Chitinispirillaceae bacterium]